MDFISIIRIFIHAEWIGNFELYISSLEQRLPYLVAAGHDKYTFTIRKYLQHIKNLCPCLEKKYKEGSWTICINDKLFWNGTFTEQVIEQILMRSGKSQGGLINYTQWCNTNKMVTIAPYSSTMGVDFSYHRDMVWTTSWCPS